MYGAASLTLTDRFAWLIDGLCKAIGVDAQKCRMEAALAWAVWNRVRVLGARLVALMARVGSGRRVPVRTRRSGRTPPPGPLPQGEGEKCPHPSPRDQARWQSLTPPRERERETSAAVAAGDVRPALPREFGWVRRVLPETARFAGVLAYFLDDPEMAALVATTPEAGRILRPLCHLLGVQPPAFLRRGAVAAQATVAPIAAEARLDEPAPPLPEREPPPSAPTADASVTNGAAVTPPAEDAALAYARRPGGLYWDGTRMRWS